MKAYKVFDPNWQCRDFQYKVGETYTMKESPVLCEKGFHACKKVSDCFSYYTFDPKNKVAEVELLGEIVGEDGDKQATNAIKIVKEISWVEMLELANSGNQNSGNRNSGDQNSGDQNSGYQNSGNRNSGDQNSGDLNSGHRNSGNWNSGNRNSGNWNSGNWNSGYFNIDEPPIRIFGKETSERRGEISFPSFLYFDLTSFVSFDTATEEERIQYKSEIETCGGFIKTLEYKDAFRKAWDNASEEDHEAVKKLPNFDADIFFEISGIRV